MIIKKYWIFIVMLLFAAAFFASAAVTHAQEAQEKDELGYIDESFFDGKPVDDGYIPSLFPELTKMYWAVGKFDYADGVAIDNFMKINDCEMYTSYYNNEFEWVKIRDAAREYITLNVAKFPTKFEVMVPVFLGRYDTEKEEFEVDPESMMAATTRIDVIVNKLKKYCGMFVATEVENYPSNMIVELNRPVAFMRLPVPQELAAFFIDYADRSWPYLIQELKRRDRARVAYLRLKVTVLQYKETVLVNSKDVRAVIRSRLDGLEVYADPERRYLIYEQKLKKKRPRRGKKRNASEEVPLGGAEPNTAAP